MTCFNQFPSLVLNGILHRTIGFNELNLDDWKKSLSLLGVCRKWRELGLYLVYRNAILEGLNEYSGGFVENLEGPTEDKLINTNIGLIKALGNTPLVKNLFIKINHSKYCRLLVNEADEVFSFDDCDWGNVSKITISGWVTSGETNEHMYRTKFSKDSMCFAKKVAKNMPNVSKLYFPIYDRVGLGSTVVNHLSEVYSHNLKSLFSLQPLVLTRTVDYSQLTTLNVNANINAMKFILHICCEKLRSLTLRNITQSFSWKELVNVKQIKNIEFSCLHSLKLIFASESDMHSCVVNPTKLYFPSLKHLDITTPTFNVLEHVLKFEHYQWPSVTKMYVHVIEFSKEDSTRGSAALIRRSDVLASCIRYFMPKVTQIRLGIFGTNNEEIYFYSVLANLYADQLTHIDFAHPTSFTAYQFSSKLMHLILNAGCNSLQRLPKVTTEALQYLHLSNADSSFDWSIFQDETGSQAINFSQLNKIVIKYNWDNEDNDLDYERFTNNKKKESGRLSITCPNLNTIYIENTTINRLQRIFCYGSSQWPSVSSINFRFKGTDIIEKKNNINGADYMQATLMFAKYLAEGTPNISDINMYSPNADNEYVKQLSTIIVNSHAHQLKSYICNVPVILTADMFSSKLRNLQLKGDNNACFSLPKINAANIETFIFEANLEKFSWNSFARKDDLNTIVFGNLKRFTVKHTAGDFGNNVTGQSNAIMAKENNLFTLHMPALRNIEIYNIQDKSKLWNGSINFNHLHKANIDGSYRGLGLIGNVSSGKIDLLNATIKVISVEDTNNFNKTIGILINNVPIKVNSTELLLDMDLSKWDLRHVQWGSLQKLNFCRSVKFSILVDLIANAPSLTKISLENIVYDGNYKSNLEQVLPISKCITKLQLRKKVIADNKEMRDYCISFLVFALPSLEQVGMPVENFDHAKFIRANKSWCPRLDYIIWL